MATAGSISVRAAWQSLRSSRPNLFDFVDRSGTQAVNTGINWNRNLKRNWRISLGYSFSRQISRVTPYFAGRENVSGDAGIAGNSQEPRNWGPPTLRFSNGLASLMDGGSSLERTQSSKLSASIDWYATRHHAVFGADLTRSQFNNLGEQNPRGTFTFYGSTTGNAVADFLLGRPDTASLTAGNANKYFRQTVYDAFLQDEWKARSAITLVAGLRWEYAAPVTELFNHLANLDMASGFTAATAVVAANPSGALTGPRYPRSLIEPDKRALQPRVGLAWRPLANSSLVLRSGYGIYYDTPVYRTIALQLSQQPPLSTVLSAQGGRLSPLNMADAFLAAASAGTATFAVDPHFRMGYAQNWYLAAQENLPAALQLTLTYQGIKGTHGIREFLPNTDAPGAVASCPSCPTGFVYLTSGANSSRQAGIVQLRRRLRSGFTATAQYTFSKSIDDASALAAQSVTGGGLAVAQDWRNLRAERSLSNFDQRHAFEWQLQYTTGMGVAGGMLRHGWSGKMFKQWTVVSRLNAGSGLPQTPIYMAALTGTAIDGTVRPNYTGAPIHESSEERHINPLAFQAPPPGTWGTAGRNCIIGPAQFNLNASLSRDFRLRDRYDLEFRADAANLLNHVTYTAWNTHINSSQFGLPVAANSMRTLQTTFRWRF